CEVARVAAGRLYRTDLLRIAARERDLMAAVAQEAGAARPPRPAADDHDSHGAILTPRNRLTRDEVDRHGHALEPEVVADLVLDPVAVVAGDQTRVVDREAKAGWARGDLRPVEQIEALAVPRRRLPPFAQLGEESVELGRRDTRRVLVEQALDPVEQPLDATTGLRRHRHVRRPLAQAPLELGAN